MMRLTPIVTGIAAGAVDGVIAQNDAVHAERVEWYKKFSTYYEAALLIGGLIADQMRMLSPGITEPLMISGGALLGKTVTEAMKIGGSGVTAYAVPHYAVPMARPAAFGAVNKQPTMSLI